MGSHSQGHTGAGPACLGERWFRTRPGEGGNRGCALGEILKYRRSLKPYLSHECSLQRSSLSTPMQKTGTGRSRRSLLVHALRIGVEELRHCKERSCDGHGFSEYRYFSVSSNAQPRLPPSSVPIRVRNHRSPRQAGPAPVALDHGCPWVSTVLSKATQHGQMNILGWEQETSRPLTHKVSSGAARGEHLDIIKWACFDGCPWDVDTCSGAAVGGHLAFCSDQSERLSLEQSWAAVSAGPLNDVKVSASSAS